ncbi:MAG: hypothetical protein E7057_04495 [Lentisphaerae bacterium]|nr:hypothetical protein [Lentisphaerota bacterium]
MNIDFLSIPAACGNNAFHPAVAVLSENHLLMSFQRIFSSDCYGACEFCESFDGGRSWSEARGVPGFESKVVAGDYVIGIADVRCFTFPDKRHVLFIGCTARYHKKKIEDFSDIVRGSYYTVYDSKEKRFHPVRMLADSYVEWRAACTQLYFTGKREFLLPIYFGINPPNPRFAVQVLKISLSDSFEIASVTEGNSMTNTIGRGLIEPSIVRHGNRFFLTIRAEDGNGYFAVSDDGLNFASPQKWMFDDGSEFVTSSTQQHWFCLDDKLYLAYTRKSCGNVEVFRYRAPLWASEVIVDGEKLRLKKSAETIILPMKKRNSDTGLCGNFHTVGCRNDSIISDACIFADSGMQTEVCIAKVTP